MQTHWWHEIVMYQIYPRSFQDSNGDGIGDIPGIISRLDYLSELGIGGIWLSPVYASPMADNGYDISDYQQIASEFGTMADMERLIKEAEKRGIKIVMDLVVNHTSDEHPWFVEARQSKDSSYRDFYIWRDEPNALISGFTGDFPGSAWTKDEVSGQYYLHLFSAKQPDLNWSNDKVRRAVYEMMNFWVAKGIGGFRMDVISLIGKNPDKLITDDGELLHPYLQEMHQAALAGKDLMTVGETWSATPDTAKLYSKPEREELSMVFQFEHITAMWVDGRKWKGIQFSVPKLKEIFNKWQVSLGLEEGWNSLFWNNHDLPRVVSAWGNDTSYRSQSATAFAIVLHLMRGTPYIYQGEEIGMTNFPFERLEQVNDIESKTAFREIVAKGCSTSKAMAAIRQVGRDNARTPMQWDQTAHAGFTRGNPWLAANPNYQTVNVAARGQVFETYQQLIALRRANDWVKYGTFELLETSENVFAFLRQFEEKSYLIVANLSDEVPIFESNFKLKELLLHNYEGTPEISRANLRAWEAFVCEIL